MSNNNKKLFPLSLAALGVVYGDIGTSPLYALRESLHGMLITSDNILGVLSLIFWSLVLVISVCYLGIFVRANNQGEGGVLALLALLKGHGKTGRWFFVLGILAAGLLLGDGMLTPAISVISAVEGLKVISPAFAHYVLPLTVCILLALFLVQRFGTGKIGSSFGPIILCWFFVIGALGVSRIIENIEVIYALNPYYALQFFHHNGLVGYIILGGIFLVITGTEALYTDLGHFGKAPIRLGWYAVALPGLLLNYFGQGAFLLKYPQAISNPFYAIAPLWSSFPLLIIATMATIIASQAVISASFSMTKQAILLNVSPRLPIVQTSREEAGQIYIPRINFILAVGTLLLVIIFKSSTALASAYGIAVNLVMVIDAIMVIQVAHSIWRWPVNKIIVIFSLFVLIDFAFLGANSQKLAQGGWIPIVIAALFAVIMITWFKGIELLRSSYYINKISIPTLIKQFAFGHINRIPNTVAIFITDPYDQSGGSFLHYLKLNHIMPEHVIIVCIEVADLPFVHDRNRFQLTKIGADIYHVVLRFGFMQSTHVPKALAYAEQIKLFPFSLNVEEVSFSVEIINVLITKKKYPNLFFWQKKLFALLLRNSALELDFYCLPYNRTVAIGTYCEI